VLEIPRLDRRRHRRVVGMNNNLAVFPSRTASKQLDGMDHCVQFFEGDVLLPVALWEGIRECVGRLSRFAQVTPGTFRTAGVRPNVYSRRRRRSQIKYAWPSGEKGEPPTHVRQRRARDTTSAVRRGAHGGPDALEEYPAVR